MMDTYTIEALKQIRALFNEPEKFTKGSYSRDVNGHIEVSTSDNAYSFCLVGAINHVCNINKVYPLNLKIRELFLNNLTVNTNVSNRGVSIEQWNDDPKTTYQDLLNLIDSTIRLAESQLDLKL